MSFSVSFSLLENKIQNVESGHSEDCFGGDDDARKLTLKTGIQSLWMTCSLKY